MLGEYKEVQSFAYHIIKNSVLNGKLSHAYLIDSNNYDKAYDFALSFAKFIFCRYGYEYKEKCDDCNICTRIDNGNYLELKVIEADGLVIKKEQLLELQSEFNLSSIEGHYRVYIIRDCEKMNKQASNSLLKFLEEPVDGVVAILLTNHLGKLLSTIVSRCQVIRLSNDMTSFGESTLKNFALVSCDSKMEIDTFITDDFKLELIDMVLSFACYFENNGYDIFIYLKKRWGSIFGSRDNTILFVFLLIYLYYDVLKYKLSLRNYFFVEYVDEIREIASNNSVDMVNKKLGVFQYVYDMLKCNLNVNLLIDDMIIRLGEIDG